MKRILFLVRRRRGYGYVSDPSTGLLTSAQLVVDMINKSTYHSAVLEIAQDGNSIDALIVKHRPNVVIVEAIWVVPAKFAELKRLHPNVTFVVRLHSNIPFIAQEGMAVEWLKQYDGLVKVSCNSKQMVSDLTTVLTSPVSYTPNYYPYAERSVRRSTRRYERHSARDGVLNIGCFGAIRPFKNHLAQAIAAISFVRGRRRKLRFHINVGRVEGGYASENILKNLRALFAGEDDVQLVEHPWLPHAEFLSLLGEMDMSMQVSFTETFNIVSADAVSVGIPIVVSKAVDWAMPLRADPTDTQDIMQKLSFMYIMGSFGVAVNRKLLQRNSDAAQAEWARQLG